MTANYLSRFILSSFHEIWGLINPRIKTHESKLCLENWYSLICVSGIGSRLWNKWQPTPVFLPGESQGRGAWWAAIYGVAQSQTRLKQLSSSSSSPWYHSTLAFYPSPASLLPGDFSITPKCSQELQDGKSGNIWILLLLLHHPAWSHCQIQHCCSLAQLCLTLCDPKHYSAQASPSFTREGHTGLAPF